MENLPKNCWSMKVSKMTEYNQNDLNVIMALALIQSFYNKGQISLKVFKKCKDDAWNRIEEEANREKMNQIFIPSYNCKDKNRRLN